jgi:hypothetical protein
MQATITGLLGRDKLHARIEEIKKAVGTLICEGPGA